MPQKIRVKDKELLKEFMLMASIQPTTLEMTKMLCDTCEEYMEKYPFLRGVMKREGRKMVKDMQNQRKEMGL